MFKQEIKHYIYVAVGSSEKFRDCGFCKTFDDEIVFGRLIMGKTYDCYQNEKRPNEIEVSGFFHVRTQMDKTFSKKPGFYTMTFKAIICKEYLKFLETFTISRPKKYARAI